MGKTRLSIVIATYNSEKTLRLALNSVVNQQFEDWECIIVDGASTDSTMDIARQYAAKDSRIKYISETDKGIYDALNKGWKLANGEWIYVLGSDDTVTDNGLDELLKECGDYDVVYGNAYIKKATGEIKKFVAKKVKALSYVMICSHQAVIVRKDVISRLNGFNLDYKVRADFDLLQRAYLSGSKFKYVNTFVAYFASTGYSSSVNISTHFERYRICKNNKSTSFPLFWYCYQESKFLFRHFILNKIKS